jgi:hypothetical protein
MGLTGANQGHALVLLIDILHLKGLLQIHFQTSLEVNGDIFLCVLNSFEAFSRWVFPRLIKRDGQVWLSRVVKVLRHIYYRFGKS